jgi:hypothetical protein
MKSFALRSLAIIGSLSLLLSACSSQALEVEQAPPPVVEETEEEQAAALDVPRHPLTGFELGTNTVSGPSLAIKIDNTGPGRPQVGISAADLVFEELVEGGVTRYLAVYHTAIPDEVGPVRSGRPQDADLVVSLGGVFIFSGVGNQNVRDIIRQTGLTLVEHDRPSDSQPGWKSFFRSTRKSAPLNLHIRASELLENYTSLDAPQQQFEYRTNPAESSAFVDGVDAESINVVFSSLAASVWEWDAASGTYLKFLTNGSPDNDANGTQISATNVVILTPNYFDIEALPSANVAGTGEAAYIATGGKMISGSFDATELGAPLKLTYGDNQPVYLAPGKTFVLLGPGAGSQTTAISRGGFMIYRSNGEEVIVTF